MRATRKSCFGYDEKKFFQIGVQMPPWERQELIDFLRKNIDVFTWNAYKAPGLDLNFICLRLMSIHLPSPRSNHLDAHLGNILMLSGGKYSSLSELGP